jgi:hypothetical protein
MKNYFYLSLLFILIACKPSGNTPTPVNVAPKCQLLAANGFRYEYQNNLPVAIDNTTLTYANKRIDANRKNKIVYTYLLNDKGLIYRELNEDGSIAEEYEYDNQNQMILRKRGFYGDTYEWKNGNLVRIIGASPQRETTLTYDNTISVPDSYLFAYETLLNVLALYGYYGKMPDNPLTKLTHQGGSKTYTYTFNSQNLTNSYTLTQIIRSGNNEASQTNTYPLTWLCP